jgi:transposase
LYQLFFCPATWEGGQSASKYHSEELKAYVKDHPEATLAERAEHFGGSVSGAHDALARAGITFKKRALLHREGRREASGF